MVRITESLIRKRAEHNEGMVSTLEEVALHQQNIEKIEALGQLCPHLKILYLQNNLIGKLQNLNKLKELEYLNIALNNITKIQNLQRCESLKRLDLTVNFIDKPALLTVETLKHNYNLEELYLLGNPCTDWDGYRQFIIAKLLSLKKLDGQDIKPSERILACQALPSLERRLRAELLAAGVDPDLAAFVEDDSLLYDEDTEIPETGYVDPETGDLKRPWCPATRLLEHREQEKLNREADAKKKAGQEGGSSTSSTSASSLKPKRHDTFPPLEEEEMSAGDGTKIRQVMQRNEGRWDFYLDESEDGRNLVLDLAVERLLDTSLIQTDLRPKVLRVLIKGLLLQLRLPCEIRPDDAMAQRSKLTGHLVITMPKDDPTEVVTDVSLLRPFPEDEKSGRGKGSKPLAALDMGRKIAVVDGSAINNGGPEHSKIRESTNCRQGDETGHRHAIAQAVVSAVGDEDDEDDIPDL
uniref:Dynein axonemal assembly factor 11-like CS domain-containing protein n=1 Tax=Polytomella parva TaxID=51329 RepID=A0A7S0VCE6_9CHLO|mmetsp:Transcript_32776/g.59389  ORF Transcript_32776/g.59389 Transcript_32776/m.59389 type:complete len:467 (+) Transcript_32776:174-1574(+)